MSADNYIAIYEDEFGRLSGYMLSASDHWIAPNSPPEGMMPLWVVNTKEQAIAKCEEEEYLEYGYEFVG